MRFRKPSGAPAKLTLGPLDLSGKEVETEPLIGHPLTLAGARALAAEIARQRVRGRDVVADHHAAKSRQRFEHETRSQNTFAGAAKSFIEQYASKKTRRWQQQARLLGLKPTTAGLEIIRGGLADRWRDRPIVDIDGHDIYSVVEETRQRGTPGLERRSDGPTEAQARVMLACLSKMFSWLTQHRRIDKNPCTGVHRPTPSKARDRVLTDSEIVKFWFSVDCIGENFSTILRLLLLTGARLNEVAGMTGSELSEDGMTWNIPADRTKNKRPHVLPLSPLARKLLKRMAPSTSPLIFTTTGNSPVSGFSKIKARLDRKMLIPPWKLHDLRRTAATGMAEIGIAPHIVEAVLNHLSGAKASVTGVYNRAVYAAEKRLALERWAEHVTHLTSENCND